MWPGYNFALLRLAPCLRALVVDAKPIPSCYYFSQSVRLVEAILVSDRGGSCTVLTVSLTAMHEILYFFAASYGMFL